jgi:hypothetical protein
MIFCLGLKSIDQKQSLFYLDPAVWLTKGETENENEGEKM